MPSIIKKHTGKDRTGKLVGLLLFLAFAIVGSIALYTMTIRPMSKISAARTWPAVSCTIISAEVGTHDGSDSTTYSIDIVYRYTCNEQEYQSDRYDFMTGSSSGYTRKANVVQYYREAQQPVCFINPDNPAEAVLNKDLHLGYLWALFPLPFVAVGFGGLTWSLKNWTTSVPHAGNWLPAHQTKPVTNPLSVAYPATDAVVITSKSPWKKLLFCVALAAFWNGIVSVFLVNAVQGWKTGAGDLFLTLFLIPFVLIGIGLIIAVLICMLALFNPRPTLTLSSATIPLGGTARLTWHFKGRTGMIRQLKILLRGIESARYQRGTNTVTDKNTFYAADLLSTHNPIEIPSGQTDISIPASTMHSFEAANNRIIWEICIQGEIDMWPDINDHFKLIITPGRTESH